MTILHLDYETYSRCDLIKQGAHNYARHPSTGIHCLGWAFDEDDPEIWTPADGTLPSEVFRFMSRREYRSLHAHNAQFERLITEHVLRPHLQKQGLDFIVPLDAWYCTAAQARARALPAGLDDLGRALKLPLQKDRRGKDLIKLLCVPRLGRAVNFVDGEFLWEQEDCTELLAELYQYCKTDVIVERAAEACSGGLTDTEYDDYLVNEMINDRGITVDLEFAHAAQEYAAEEVEEISEEISRLTNGQVTTPKQYKRIKDWLEPYMENDFVRHTMTIYKTDRQTKETHKKISFDRNVRQTLLEAGAEDPELVPQPVMDLAELTDEASRSSVSKYRAMEDRGAPNGGRVFGSYIYAGAGQTKRFSSKGLQVHNMRRASRDDFEEIRQTIIAEQALPDGEVMEILSACMRQTLVAKDPDHRLVWGDWSAIEARVLPWLTLDELADPLLERFWKGEDVYIGVAAGIYGVSEIDQDMRQIGKVAQLSLGYQGAVRALQAMARNYGIVIDDDFAIRIVGKWRASNRWATRFWRRLESAAKKAVRNPGELFEAGRVRYVFDDDRETLYCMLPNGEWLSYPQCRLEDDALSAMKAMWKPAADSDDEWPRVDLYGGLFAENVTQATAAAVLRDTLRALEDLGWPVIGHTHDEALLEVLKEEVGEARSVLRWCMVNRWADGTWAADLPLGCDINHGRRYRK